MISFERKEPEQEKKPAQDKAPPPPHKVIGSWDTTKGERRVKHEKRPPSEEWREPGPHGPH
jgi:hypothetical protein